MGDAPPHARVQYRFGHWTLDPDQRLLLDSATPVFLQGQTFDLLLYLVRNPGRVVGKDELLKGAWGHSCLTDSAITQAVRRLRKALGDSGRRQSIIRTVHGRGFEFLPSVQVDVCQPRPPDGGWTWPRLAPVLAGFLIVAVLVVLGVVWRPGHTPSTVAAKAPAWRLLIEPLEGLAGIDEEWQWLVEGLPATVEALLRDHPAMEILGSAAVPELLELPPGQRARGAGADLYLTMRLDRIDGRFSLFWQLRQPGQDSDLRSGDLTGPDPGLLVRQLVDQVRNATTRGSFPVRVAHKTVLDDPLAVELYTRAMQAIASEQRVAAAKLLDAALTRQPDSALLQVALAKARFDPANQAGEALDGYQELIDQIPDAEPIARAWLAHELGTELWFYGNTRAAEAFLEEALALIEPHHEPLLRGRILNSLAFVQQSRNRYSVAWETALDAERLLRGSDSPYFLSMVLTNLGYLAEDFGRLLQAREFHLEALALREQIGVDELTAASEYGIARIERRLGQLARASQRLETNLERSGVDNRPFDRFDNLEELAEVRMRQGRFAEAAALLDQAGAIAAESNDEIGLAWTDEVRARLGIASGQVAPELLARIEQARQRFEALGEAQEAFTARLSAVEIMQMLGQTGDSGTVLTSLKDHPALANPVHQIRFQMILARQAELARRDEQAEELLTDALKRARQLGSVDQEAAVALRLARRALARNDASSAERFVRIAQRWSPEHFRTLALDERLHQQRSSTR